MAGAFADLHIHSYYSDGTMSPEEIVRQALEHDVGLIAWYSIPMATTYEIWRSTTSATDGFTLLAETNNRNYYDISVARGTK